MSSKKHSPKRAVTPHGRTVEAFSADIMSDVGNAYEAIKHIISQAREGDGRIEDDLFLDVIRALHGIEMTLSDMANGVVPGRPKRITPLRLVAGTEVPS